MLRTARRRLLATALVAWAWAGSCGAEAPPAAPGVERPAPPASAPEGRPNDGSASRAAEAVARDGDDTAAERTRAGALDAMERLRDEIRTLTALRDAQTALVEWSRERAKTGRGPAALPGALCRDAKMQAWCALVPATFGADAGGGSHDGD